MGRFPDVDTVCAGLSGQGPGMTKNREGKHLPSSIRSGILTGQLVRSSSDSDPQWLQQCPLLHTLFLQQDFPSEGGSLYSFPMNLSGRVITAK